MDKNIGVGTIVGLITASSIYIWNSNSFSKEQKTFLLICFIFPPAQWLGILIVLIYNSNKEKNTVEYKTESKLDLTIHNLKDLKEKGILTIEEYDIKIKKIKLEKEEFNIKNSIEYKQLNNLLDSGILTKNEYEDKILLLKQTANIVTTKTQTVYRETINGQILKIVSDPNKTIGADVYIDDIIAPDGIYKYKFETQKLIIEKGKIKERYFIEKLKVIIIEQSNANFAQKGEKVFLYNGSKAPTGIYSMGFLSFKVVVEDGIFVKYK